MKAVLILILIINLNCQIEFLDYEAQETIDTKHQDDDNMIPILIDDCMTNPIFSPTQKSCAPNEYHPNINILLNIRGIMANEQKIKSLYIENNINNYTISNNTIDYGGQVVPAGKYYISYNITLGEKVILGLDEYYLYLINTNDERISCSRVYFETK
jgi:hypothetical protein